MLESHLLKELCLLRELFEFVFFLGGTRRLSSLLSDVLLFCFAVFFPFGFSASLLFPCFFGFSAFVFWLFCLFAYVSLLCFRCFSASALLFFCFSALPCFVFLVSQMRSEGFYFGLWGSGGWLSLDAAFLRPQPSATVPLSIEY